MSKVNATGKAVRKSTKGVPRITNKVLAGGEALDKYNEAVGNLPASVQAECKARLEKAMKEGPKVGTGTVAKLEKKVARLTSQLADAQKALDAAVLNQGAEEEARLNAIVAKANAQIELLKAAKSRSAVQA